MNSALRVRSGTALLAAASFVAVYAFLQQAIEGYWPAWFLAPAVVLGFWLVLRRTRPSGPARQRLLLAAAVLVPLAAVYTLLQEAIDPDWPAWVLAPLLVLGFWIFLASLGEAFADE